MAVLVEAISVIVRRDAIDAKYPGGWEAFVEDTPNATLCYDDEIARVGFMAPSDIGTFVNHLERHGLRSLEDGKAVDLAVADQQQGLATECDWLEFGRIELGDSGKVSACWLFEGPRMGYGLHMPGTSMQIATPPGWQFEGSLSQKFGFVPSGQENKRLEFLRNQNGVDVFIDLTTGKEVYVGRTRQ